MTIQDASDFYIYCKIANSACVPQLSVVNYQLICHRDHTENCSQGTQKMKSPDNIRPRGATMNMTPMIDIVFLLIVFFLVSSNLIQQDVSMELELPAAETAQPTPEAEAKKITVNIPAPDRLLLGAQPVGHEKLREYFLQRRKEWGADTGLRIRTNKDVPYGEVEPILVLAAESGIWNVSFAVIERR